MLISNPNYIAPMGKRMSEAEFSIPSDYELQLTTSQLMRLVSSLKPREEAAIRQWMYDWDSYEDNSKHFGVSRERLRQILVKAVKNMRSSLRRNGIKVPPPTAATSLEGMNRSRHSRRYYAKLDTSS
jgi:hypothetical protein